MKSEEVHLISNFAVHPVAAIDTHLDKSRWVSEPRQKELEVSEPNLEMLCPRLENEMEHHQAVIKTNRTL